MADLQTVYPRIETARGIVAEEIDVVDNEIEAFESFRARLDRLEKVGSSSVDDGGGLITKVSVSSVDAESVRGAYKDTVMATAHYDREYGDSLLESVAAEFGSTVGTLFAEGGPITSVQVGVIETAADQALDERAQFRRSLAAELASLENIEARLDGVERRFHGIIETAPEIPGRASRLQELVTECQTIGSERQSDLHRGPSPRITGVGDQSLVSYLYDDREWQFPALTEITQVAEHIKRAIWK